MRSRGHRVSIFIDDSRVLGRSAAGACAAAKLLFVLFDRCGFVLNEKKSMKPEEAAQKVKYLGFWIDTRTFQVTAPEEKLASIVDITNGLRSDTRWPVRRWASLHGKLVSLKASHGTRTLVTSRPLAIAVDEHTKKYGWGKRVYLCNTEEIMVGLKIFLQYMH